MNVVARDVVDCLEVFVDEWVMNVVARDVVDCLEVFVPLRGALSTVEPATRVHAVNSFDVRLLAVAFAFAFFAFLGFLAVAFAFAFFAFLGFLAGQAAAGPASASSSRSASKASRPTASATRAPAPPA